MDATFMRTMRERTEQAIASGDLQPIDAEQIVIRDGGLPFIIRWVASLAKKDAVKGGAGQQDGARQNTTDNAAAVTLPGGPRNPDFNPFLNPDPALLIGPMGEHHVAILNKFPVCLHHLVLARRNFAEQSTPLEAIDFLVLALILSHAGGLGFYNGGAAAGASQRHKHVQWIPASPDNATLRNLAEGLSADMVHEAVARHPALSMAHCFVRMDLGADPYASAQAMQAAFELACATLGLRPDADGFLPPCNMLVGDGWMLVLPRSQEHFQGISVNALSFGGTIYVRDPAQIDAIRQAGPLHVLASVGIPAGSKSRHGVAGGI